MKARVVLLAGPSGSGKSRLAVGSGLPIVQLDDFYKDGDDPTLPRFTSGAVDWDYPASWDGAAALSALRELCTQGKVGAPVYDIAANARVGSRVVDLDGATHVVAEGIFAADMVGRCRDAGILESAICVRRSRWVTFVLRLVRDLREHRKPPLFLVRRGVWLARREPDIVAGLISQGFAPMAPRQVERHLLVRGRRAARHTRA